MRNLLLLFSVLLLFMSCTTENIDDDALLNLENDTNEIILEDKPFEIEIMNLINEYRVDKGLTPLEKQNGIVKLKAKEHNMYMIKKSAISHDLFYERSNNIIKKIKAKRVGENVASGYNNAERLVNAWIASPKHKKNILGDFNKFNISVEFSQNKVMYCTNIFIKK